MLAYNDENRNGYILHILMVAQHLQFSPLIQRHRQSLRFKTAPYGRQPHAWQVLCHVLRFQIGPTWRWVLVGLHLPLCDA